VASLYQKAVQARRHAYETSRRPKKRLPRPVISVGNLTVGGTGKTPFVLYLCDKLSGWRHVAILSRGYGRRNPRAYVTLPDARQLDERAPLFFGDEPVMMAKHIANASIHLGPNRWRTGRLALDRAPVDLFILDDGFQHVELHRDLDIVILNGQEDPRRLGVLPAGMLREPAETLRRADIVVISRCTPDGQHQIDLDWVRSLCPNAPIVLARYAIVGAFDLKTGNAVPLDDLRNHPLFAFCGIAEPTSFRDTLTEAGLKLVGHHCYGDHHYFRGRELHDIETEAVAAGAAGLITTEKDAVRILPFRIRGLPIYRLDVKFVVLEGEERLWERIGDALHGR